MNMNDRDITMVDIGNPYSSSIFIEETSQTDSFLCNIYCQIR
jgi:hypothetical protein